ncbi:helix-turn-helix transcriptional regulator [Amycolatopsis jiangsuensis]|uniref:Transcriptional regulator with XRE-family HTH domain n=1 Tax=Amycolatopsis jiangsuensis TaxID=1181879 RepID=A0A840ITT7_9PSEU|nr:helix-turn-helix transcriptional regulator [Amycolatopsis jiangsuensis]MBB4684394.1 transcriptional regulator with XRE-family HTH domain [Amycolatopsis jiangsuensis]
MPAQPARSQPALSPPRANSNLALGSFLRSRRDRLTPAQAGITAFPGLRRVPGLRKEEVAVLAGISPDHYSRLEQGRQATLSEELCDALARALRLDEFESRHLRTLAARSPRRARWRPAQVADPGLLRVMTALDELPVLLLGQRTEVLARNTLLDAVLGVVFEPGASFVRWLLLEPAARERITNWDHFAAAAVGNLRYEIGRHPGDTKLADLVNDLRASSADVSRWWDEQGVIDQTSLVKRILHPAAGPLEFGVEAVTAPHCPDQRLVIYTVEPDSPTARIMPLLHSWTRSPEQTRVTDRGE